jgi:N4-(beta-N-acetylglucosaminyl)-L-asparaginase
MSRSRRSFLHRSFLGAFAASSATFWDKISPELGGSEKKVAPFAVATWGPNTKATRVAGDMLLRGAYALDAVEAGVRVPESDPEDTSVGYGGMPDRDGFVTLDACIMDEKGMAGSVCGLEQIMHPVTVARSVLEKTPHVMLLEYALSIGLTKENLLTENAKKAWEAWKLKSEYKPVINVERHDTIGMLCMDQENRLVGACSTSGLAFKMRGRVGDSPIIGAGLFIDNEVGGATCTGLGEIVLRTLGSFLVVEEMRRGATPQKATETAIKRIARNYPQQCKDAQVAFIAADKKGNIGAYSIHPGFNYAIFQNGENKVVEAKSWMSK